MFYKKYVDIASVKSMWEFLHNHFTYSTMNSWNGLKSIAHNVKLYNLNLEGDWYVALQYLHDESDPGGLQMAISDMIDEFERDNRGYRVGFNGRSGGYLVLYNDDNYRSVLPDIVLDYDTYEEFKEDQKYYGYNVSDHTYELREVVRIVRAFDLLCDQLRDLVNKYSKESFDNSKLEDAVERFYIEYEEDLVSLDLQGPEVEDDHVNLHDISDYNSFMTLFYQCLGEDHTRAYVNGNLLYLKED